MSRSSRDLTPDQAVQQVLEVFAAYDAQHPDARIEAYRQNSAAIRIRIVDPSVAGTDRVQREDQVWQILDQLPGAVRSQISFLLVLTPQEASRSFASYEFDNPLPSLL